MSLESTNGIDRLSIMVEPATKAESDPLLLPKTNARSSNIRGICEKAIENGYKSCIWVCFSRGSSFFARDVPLKEEEGGLEIHSLRNRCGWWKRISLRSPVKIREVKVHAIRTQSNKEIEVMVLPINYASEMANIQRALEELSADTTNCGAGFNRNGTFQRCSKERFCQNAIVYDNGVELEVYCSLERRHELRKDFRNLQYRQPMLDFYWNSRGKSDCQQFLKESGLVREYTYLRTCDYLDAAVCYGDTFPGEGIPALLLVDGWNVSRLLIIIGIAVLIAIVVTAIGTAAGRNIGTGLTAGGYAFGAASVLVATLTLFSAVR